MAITTPPTIDALPTPPNPDDRATFNQRAYPWSLALATFTTQANAVAANVKANADETKTNSDAAVSSAASAAASKNAASTSASAAADSAASASTSAGAAASFLFDFRAQYLGALASDPVADGNGNPLSVGDLYFNTSNGMRVYTGSAWTAAYLPAGAYLELAGGAMTGNLSMTDKQLNRAMLKDTGYAYFDAGNVTALDYSNGSHQRWAPTGTKTLAISNWPPSGNLGELLIEGVNLGSAVLTWPTINWIKSDGTTTTNIANAGFTLQASGTDWVVLWTRDSGAATYGKVVR